MPVPGSRPRLRRKRFFAVTKGEHKGAYESYAEELLRHSKALSFVSAYIFPAVVNLGDCAAPDLIIVTDGSYTP